MEEKKRTRDPMYFVGRKIWVLDTDWEGKTTESQVVGISGIDRSSGDSGRIDCAVVEKAAGLEFEKRTLMLCSRKRQLSGEGGDTSWWESEEGAEKALESLKKRLAAKKRREEELDLSTASMVLAVDAAVLAGCFDPKTGKADVRSFIEATELKGSRIAKPRNTQEESGTRVWRKITEAAKTASRLVSYCACWDFQQSCPADDLSVFVMRTLAFRLKAEWTRGEMTDIRFWFKGDAATNGQWIRLTKARKFAKPVRVIDA